MVRICSPSEIKFFLKVETWCSCLKSCKNSENNAFISWEFALFTVSQKNNFSRSLFISLIYLFLFSRWFWVLLGVFLSFFSSSLNAFVLVVYFVKIILKLIWEHNVDFEIKQRFAYFDVNFINKSELTSFFFKSELTSFLFLWVLVLDLPFDLQIKLKLLTFTSHTH